MVCAWRSTKDEQRSPEGFFNGQGLTSYGQELISTGCTVNVAGGEDSYTFKSESMQNDYSSSSKSCVVADNSLGLLKPKDGDLCAVANDDPENEWFNPLKKDPALVALTTKTVNGQQRCVAEISASVTTDEIRKFDQLLIKQGADVLSGAPKLRKDLKTALSDLEKAMKGKEDCDTALTVMSAQLAPLTAAIAMWVKKGSVGALTYVSVSGDRMCGLQADDRIQYSTDGGATWKPKDGLFKNVSIDGKNACGVNKEKEIWCVDDMDLLGNGSVKWQKMDGYLDNVSVSEGRMCGTNDKGDIWWAPFNKKGAWKKKDGVLKQISINGKRGCGVNASNDILCTENIESPANDWVKIQPPDSRTLTQVSMDGGGQLCGITSSGEIYCRDDGGYWAKKEGMLKQISLDGKGGMACGVGTDDMVYCSNKLDRDNSGVIWQGSRGYGAGDSVPAATVLECASQCANKEGDTCKSIYYDPDGKLCYRFEGRYGGGGDPWREAKPRGYTGNVTQLDRDRDGYIWRGSRGFSKTGDRLKHVATAEECVYLCASKQGGSCKSMTFNSELQHCWRFDSKYGEVGSTAWRNNEPQYAAAWSTANVASKGVAAAPAPAAPAPAVALAPLPVAPQPPAAPPPAAWTKVGFEKFATVSVSDSIVCGIKKDKSIRCSEDNGSTWVTKQGSLRDVSVDGKRLCGVNDAGNLFCTYDFDKLTHDPNMWAQLTAGIPMNNVSVSASQMCTARNDNAVFCTGYNQRDWKHMPGLIKQVSLDGVAACGVNPNDQNIYCATDIGRGDWKQMPDAPEKLTQVSLKKNIVCGVGDSGAVFCKASKDTGDAWVGYPGKSMKQVQVDTSGKRVCGVEIGAGKAEDADVFCLSLA
jgi:hypothetical protein